MAMAPRTVMLSASVLTTVERSRASSRSTALVLDLRPLTVCTMDKGFRYNFSQCTKAADGVGRRNVPDLLFSFEGFEGKFGLAATQHHAFLVAVAEVANHPSCTDKSVAVGCFASAREGRDHAVSKRLEYALFERNGFIHRLSIGEFKHGVHLQFMGCGQLLTQPVDAVAPASDVGNPSGQHRGCDRA